MAETMEWTQAVALLAEIAPSPDSRPPIEVRAGDSVREVACDPAGPPRAPASPSEQFLNFSSRCQQPVTRP